MNTLSLRLPIISHCGRLKTRTILKLIFGGCAICILPLLAIYLFQVGDLIKVSLSTKAYGAEIEELKEKALILQTESTEHLSLGIIEEKIQESNFVKVEEIKYIPIPSYYFAASENQ